MAKSMADMFEELCGGVSPEARGVVDRPHAKTMYPVAAGSVSLGALPAGCTVLSMRTGMIGATGLVVICTDKGVYVAEAGKSRLTKLEPLE